MNIDEIMIRGMKLEQPIEYVIDKIKFECKMRNINFENKYIQDEIANYVKGDYYSEKVRKIFR